MAERDDEDDAETMVANRQMLHGLEALGRGSSPSQQPPPGSSQPPRSPDFPAGLIKTMPMAPPTHAVLPGGAPELAEGEGEGMPQLVINFLLICGVITAFGLMTLIYLNI